MDALNLLAGLQSRPGFKPASPASIRFAETGHPGRAPGHDKGPDFGPFNAPKAQGLLNRQVLAQLNQVLASEGLPATGEPEPADYTPEVVADRVLAFIRAGLAGVEDEAERSALLEQAAAGVEQGFAEARDILSGLGVLNGEVAENIDRTEGLIREGLDGLVSPAVPAEGDDSGLAVTGANLFQSVSVERSRSASIEIQTRDGDVVTISFAQSSSASRTLAASSNENGSAFTFEASRSRSTSFEYSVQGELDADEQQAIEDLLNRVDRVSDRFFDGDVQAAFNKAARLNFDGEEIASFSIDLQSSFSRQAVSAYEVNASNGEGGEAAVNPLQQLADYVNELRDTLASLNEGLFARPEAAAGALVTGVTVEKTAALGLDQDDDTDAALSLLEDLVDELGEDANDGDVDDGAAEPEAVVEP